MKIDSGEIFMRIEDVSYERKNRREKAVKEKYREDK
jgi:hypothetical protein